MVKKKTLYYSILAFSVVLQGISFLQYVLTDNELYIIEWVPQYAIVLFVSIILTVVQYSVANDQVRFIGFLIRFALLLISHLPTGVYLGLKQMFLFAFLIDVSFLLRFPGNIVAAFLSYATIAVTTAASLYWTTDSQFFVLSDTLYVTLYSLLVIVAFSFYRYFYDNYTRERARIDHLNKTINNLTDANTGFQHYITIAEEKSSEDERNRIIREIHDSIGYTLTTITMLSTSALESKKESLSPSLRELLSNINTYAKNGLTDIRIALRILKVKKEKDETDLQQIDRMIRAFQRATNMEIDTDFGNAKQNYNDAVSHLVFRLIQEGMVNSLRHGMATKIGVRLFEENDNLIVTINDNGRGFKELTLGIGLKGIKERVQSAQGDFSIRNTGNGVTLRASIGLRDN